MNLKLIAAIPLVAIAMLAVERSCEAQDIGYRFGVGYGYAQPYYGFQNQNRYIPYFAQHPPVYYNDQIVARSYGVSPYAAPPGITPVEMTMTPQPVVIENPYFKGEVNPSEVSPSDASPSDIAPLEEITPAEGKKPAPKKNENKNKPDKAKQNQTKTSAEVNHLNVRIDNPFFQKQIAVVVD
jgi:hypothetical protein